MGSAVAGCNEVLRGSRHVWLGGHTSIVCCKVRATLQQPAACRWHRLGFLAPSCSFKTLARGAGSGARSHKACHNACVTLQSWSKVCSYGAHHMFVPRCSISTNYTISATQEVCFHQSTVLQWAPRQGWCLKQGGLCMDHCIGNSATVERVVGASTALLQPCSVVCKVLCWRRGLCCCQTSSDMRCISLLFSKVFPKRAHHVRTAGVCIFRLLYFSAFSEQGLGTPSGSG